MLVPKPAQRLHRDDGLDLDQGRRCSRNSTTACEEETTAFSSRLAINRANSLANGRDLITDSEPSDAALDH
jgi:hypothetical protein